MPGSEQGLREAAEKLAKPMKAKGLAAQYDTLMLLIDRAEDLLDPGIVVCLSNFFLREDILPLKEEADLEEDLNALLSIISKMMTEFVNPDDHRLLTE